MVEKITINPLQKYFKEVGIMANNTELLVALAQALGIDFPGVTQTQEEVKAPSEPLYIIYIGKKPRNVKAPSEPLYIIYIGKKPRNVKAPYIAINANGELSGFTEEADVLGKGTDKVGKFTMAEIEENFPQFNHEAFLVKVED